MPLPRSTRSPERRGDAATANSPPQPRCLLVTVLPRAAALPALAALPAVAVLPAVARLLALALALAVAVAVAAVAVPRAAQAAGFDVAELMKTLARTRAGEATFVERREVRMLDRTVESSGRLAFEAPDTFIRETLKPRADRLLVKGNEVTMSRDGRSRTMPLDAAPEAAVIVEAIRGTLTGNGEALERYFEATVDGAAEQWTLQLLPRDPRLRGQVASVKVRGQQAVVREVAVLLADGDRAVMTITPVTAKAAAGEASAAAARAGGADARLAAPIEARPSGRPVRTAP